MFSENKLEVFRECLDLDDVFVRDSTRMAGSFVRMEVNVEIKIVVHEEVVFKDNVYPVFERGYP